MNKFIPAEVLQEERKLKEPEQEGVLREKKKQ
jgi:hypothetical protein